jgi:hypothetical protein
MKIGYFIKEKKRSKWKRQTSSTQRKNFKNTGRTKPNKKRTN